VTALSYALSDSARAVDSLDGLAATCLACRQTTLSDSLKPVEGQIRNGCELVHTFRVGSPPNGAGGNDATEPETRTASHEK
jgi:hypothetical protein